MKRFLLGILILAGPSTSTATVFFDNMDGAYFGTDGASEAKHRADDFTVGSDNIIVSQITLRLSGETNGVVEAFIYGDDSGSNIPNSSDIIGSLGTVTGFTNVFNDLDKVFTPSITMILIANTKYWIVIVPTASSNYSYWSINSTAPTVGVCDNVFSAVSLDSGSSWSTEVTPSSQYRMKIEGTTTTLPVELDFFMVE